jgi:hypothetical protein
MEAPVAATGGPSEEFQYEESGPNLEAAPSDANPEARAAAEDEVTVTMGESFAADTRVIVTSSGEQFSLSSAKAIDLLGEEFVAKLKAEPGYARQSHHTRPKLQQGGRPQLMLAVTTAESVVAPTTTVTAQEAAGNSLVYCNLNDLDLAEATNGGGGGGDSYSFASLHSLADASSVAQQQARKHDTAVYTETAELLTI